jgi:hypothetical protein
MPHSDMEKFLETHSGELMILVLFLLVVGALFVLVPQLLRANLRKLEMQHQQTMKALEEGHPPSPPDESTRAAGFTALLVPMVVMICAGTVTCFLVAYRSEHIFSVSIAAWSVAGVVSLAAITGGVALMGRLAQLRSGVADELADDYPGQLGNR